MQKKLKKIIFFLIIFIFLRIGNIVFADEYDLEKFSEENNFTNEELLDVSSNSTNEPKTFSKHIICIERTTNEVLYEKDAYSKTKMASTTKIMTFLIAYENSNFDNIVTISKKAANIGGSTLGIKANSEIKMESLIYGLLLRSRK